jgi:hypothetical protein
MNSQVSSVSQSQRTGRRPRWMGTAAIGTLAFVALVVVVLPGSAMAAPMSIYHTIRITAPYTGSVVAPSTSVSTYACGTASIITAPFFHPHTGHAGLSGVAATGGCSPTIGGSASAYESFSVSVPLAVIPGQDHIVAKWSLHVAGGSGLHVGKCSMPAQNNTSGFSECYASSSSSLNAYAYIIDATNGSYIASPTVWWAGLTNGSSWFLYCFAGICTTYLYGSPGTFAMSGPLAFTFNAKGLLATHSYTLLTYFYGSEYVSQASYGVGTSLTGTHTSAWLNAGTFGNGLSLNSITVT